MDGTPAVCNGYAIDVKLQYAHGVLTGIMLQGMPSKAAGGGVVLAIEECISTTIHPAR